MSKSIHRNSTESADQSSSWNLAEWESHDLTAVFEHHRSLWSCDTQQNDACVTDQENIRTADRVSVSIYDKQNLDSSAIRYWDRRKINIYLFYMTELLKTCNSIRNQLSMSVFVNDIMLLIYEQITEKNSWIFESTHDWCMNWAHCYRAFFALEKYNLIHLFRKLKKFNMQTQL